MRILHVIPSLNPDRGGTVEGLNQMANALIELGHEIEIATLDDPDDTWVHSSEKKVHALGPSKFNYRYSWKYIPWLKENASQFDAVVIEGIWQFHSLGAWLALRGGRVPYFVFTHGMLSPWFKRVYPIKHFKKWLYWPWADYRVLRDAKAVFFTCEEERLLARKSFWLYRCHEVVVGYGTVGPNGDRDWYRKVFLSRYPNIIGKRLILFMGRLHPVKGCDILLESFAMVADRDATLHLVMAGPDSIGCREALEALSVRLGIEDRVTWAGTLNDELKWGAIMSAEVLVLPSHQENFGMVVPEALACGKPVLISDRVNIWREVEASKSAIVARDTISGVVEMLTRWLDLDGKEYLSMCRSARMCFENHYEIKKVANRLSDAIAKAVQS